jgi:hypothetical protein
MFAISGQDPGKPSARVGFLLLLAALGAAAWVQGKGAGAAPRARVRWPAMIRGDLIVKEVQMLVTPPPGSDQDEGQVTKVVRLDGVVFEFESVAEGVIRYDTWLPDAQQTGKVTVLADSFAHWTAEDPVSGEVCTQTATMFGKLESTPVTARPNCHALFLIRESSVPGAWLVGVGADDIIEAEYSLTASCYTPDPVPPFELGVSCIGEGLLRQESIGGRRGFIIQGRRRFPSPDGSSQYITEVKGKFLPVQARRR